MSENVLERIKRGANVAFFGLGKSNFSLIRSLPLDRCKITLRSDKPLSEKDIQCGINWERILTGDNSCLDIDEDIIIFSPSVRRERRELLAAKERGVIFSSDLEIFLEENTKPLLAVSGSDGKSTTATLVSLMSDNSLLVGNIGNPMVEALGTEASLYVAELSSFMLRYASVKAKRACITNITPNHLDWHESFDEYVETKLSLLKSSDECVINADDSVSLRYAKTYGAYGIISAALDYNELSKITNSEVFFTLSERGIMKNGSPFIDFCDIQRKEAHNIKNLMMACAMAEGFTEDDKMREIARTFNGLEHRCETVSTISGVEYINSSIDSTPSRTAQTLTSLGKRVILLLGGRGKGTGYKELCPALKRYAKRVLIFGENREEILSDIRAYAECEIFENLEAATHRAKEIAGMGDVVLLSPASTSYDAFKDFSERGNLFKKIVLEYKK